MDERRQRKAIGGYYAAVSYLDAQVGKVMDALEKSGKRDNTIVIFTSDHGFHLGEHDFWAKVSLRDESAQVPLIICAPGKKPAVCHSFVELLDLYPTVSSMSGFSVPSGLQGKNIAPTLDDPTISVRDAAFSSQANSFGKGLLLREDRWAYIQYGEPAKGMELFDMKKDPKQYRNLASHPEYAKILEQMKKKMSDKLADLRTNDLGKPY
jgi:iduronate 2-sulfatase